jgi:excisionase family DNA binding protein
MHEDLLTVADAAQRKNVTRSAVYRAISQGQIPARRVLGHFAVRLADVEAWKPKERKGRRKGTPMSEEAKARISASQKKRWDLLKKATS